ncbi:NADPH:quinone reductase-like Zn-dependent oxidoreductase [Actinomadura pelletieri DSM 43383]|uniref:NADPH:quinone reductase-like Zn-dependent oxidoreductase n=1 Tax=Actinomadura pelletieri DSM 43383 TaxID=1120940 RepID=A0A495QGN5_9ACTN|nr:NADP-dependent oxidoreductase [Actinomadura pelletieri]RKS71009.1 NADPH:quinone reductase-like Zn-dependent oxidoreductase [Actinomadura pelletieri DSM 43383]
MGGKAQDTASDASVPTEMNAVVLDRFGGVDELAPRRIPVPEVGDDDVLLRVEYAGAGSWDVIEREGHYDGAFGAKSTFPFVLGWDAAGTVAAVGRNVTRFEVGDRVYAATIPSVRSGCYAEYSAVEAEYVAHVPDRLPTDQAGALAWDALTALTGFDVLDLRSGDSLMVFGASGGVGHMAVQLARHSGIRVLAVASGDDGVALARRLGADAVIDGRKVDVLAAAAEFAPDGLDGAFITAGGEVAERALRAVKDSGRIAWPNGVDPAPSTTPAAKVFHNDGDRTATDRLNAIIEASSFEVHLARTFPLERIADAHRALNEHYVGKMVIKIG